MHKQATACMYSLLDPTMSDEGAECLCDPKAKCDVDKYIMKYADCMKKDDDVCDGVFDLGDEISRFLYGEFGTKCDEQGCVDKNGDNQKQATACMYALLDPTMDDTGAECLCSKEPKRTCDLGALIKKYDDCKAPMDVCHDVDAITGAIVEFLYNEFHAMCDEDGCLDKNGEGHKQAEGCMYALLDPSIGDQDLQCVCSAKCDATEQIKRYAECHDEKEKLCEDVEQLGAALQGFLKKRFNADCDEDGCKSEGKIDKHAQACMMALLDPTSDDDSTLCVCSESADAKCDVDKLIAKYNGECFKDDSGDGAEHDCKTKEKWDKEKQRWCCENENLGCPKCEGTYTPCDADCNEYFQDQARSDEAGPCKEQPRERICDVGVEACEGDCLDSADIINCLEKRIQRTQHLLEMREKAFENLQQKLADKVSNCNAVSDKVKSFCKN